MLGELGIGFDRLGALPLPPTSSGPPPGGPFLLLESGSFILLESGSKILLE